MCEFLYVDVFGRWRQHENDSPHGTMKTNPKPKEVLQQFSCSFLLLLPALSHLALDKHLLTQAGDGRRGDHQRGVVRAQRVTAQRLSTLWRRLHRQAHQVQEGMACQDREPLFNESSCFSTRLPSGHVSDHEKTTPAA